jgi:hypothetical protein
VYAADGFALRRRLAERKLILGRRTP